MNSCDACGSDAPEGQSLCDECRPLAKDERVTVRGRDGIARVLQRVGREACVLFDDGEQAWIKHGDVSSRIGVP